MKTSKKFLTYGLPAVFLGFVIAVILIPNSVYAAAETGETDASETFMTISGEEDLLAFQTRVNNGEETLNAKLSNDITLTQPWTPVGDYNNGCKYSGTFDGNHFSVSVSSTEGTNYQGLFGYLDGTVQNLTVSGTISGTEYAGGIAAVNKGTITNSNNLASVTVSDPIAFAGGIAGINYGDISGCTNQGEITGTSSGSCVGGITGASPSGSISSSDNSGTVTGNSANASENYTESCVGGISGLNFNSSITQSSNSGSVSSTDAMSYTGGISGLNNGRISDCMNNGNIESPYYAGGIAGYLYYNEKAGDAVLTSSLNVGIVTPDAKAPGSIYGGSRDGVSSNNYYLTDAPSSLDQADALGVTAEQLASGEITYRLNRNAVEDVIWGQELNTDVYPVLGKSQHIVYAEFDGETGSVTGYTNTQPEHSVHEFDESGVCTVCNYRAVELKGCSLTLDGAIGANFYYYIDPSFFTDKYEIEVSFLTNGELTSDTLDYNSSLLLEDNTKVYGFQIYVDSDEATFAISPTLHIKQQNQDLIRKQEASSYRIYDYLKEIYENPDQYSRELVTLVQSLATLDYYATLYFAYHDPYEVDIPLKAHDPNIMEKLKPYAQTIGSQKDYPVKHYSSSMALKSSTYCKYSASLLDESIDYAKLYMGYREHGSRGGYTYVPAKKSGSTYYAYTDKIPASRLSTANDIAFFLLQDDGSYKQVSPVKTASPYSYLYSMNTTGQLKLMNLLYSFYSYGEASAAYFASIQ